MYAVVKTGGKQYRVSEGSRLRVERLDAAEGDSVELDQVLMIGGDGEVRIGTPLVEGGRVTAMVRAHGRGKKVRIVKFKRRKQYLKTQGHRQAFTEIEVTGISAG